MIISESSKSESTGKFLSNPSPDSENHISRVECSYTNNSERFLVKKRDFSRQYAHLYAERLLSMRVKLVTAAKKKWGNAVTIRKLHELQSNEKCVVVGTLFKHMELKPSILKEISDEHNVPPQPIQSKYIQDDDKLILEDELQRIILLGELAVQTSITGVVVAVLGMEPEDDKGKFHVEDYCFQELPEQVPRPQLTEDRFVLLVSGLELGGGGGEHMLELQLLVDLVGGQLGDPGQQSSAATIARVILAGNALARSTQDRDCLSKAKYLTKKTAAGTVEAVKSLDDILVQLAGSVDVDVMPGEFDPGNFTLPQQPLHRCMFPQAMRFPTTHRVTNPYHCTLEGISILGTSGQPVEDVFRYSALDDRLEILEKLLEWGHLAPTAPDTLACYPYYEQDPFILNECPHIYFAGNQDSFQSKIYKGPVGQEVLLVAVPKFSQRRTAVLVNLRSLDCQPVSFETSFPAGPSSNSPEVDK